MTSSFDSKCGKRKCYFLRMERVYLLVQIQMTTRDFEMRSVLMSVKSETSFSLNAYRRRWGLQTILLAKV